MARVTIQRTVATSVLTKARRLLAPVFGLCATLAVILMLGSANAQPTAKQIDYVFLIDVSGSMSGQQNHLNIFPQVKSVLQNFVPQLPAGTTAFFMPFDGVIRHTKKFVIDGPADHKSIQAYIDTLTAQGNNTAVYNSIDAALKVANGYRQSRGSDPIVAFYVYTDGDDNASKNWTLNSLLAAFDLKRGKEDWLFYTELGLPPDSQKIGAFKKIPRAQLITERPGELSPLVQLQTQISTLNFGNLKNSAKVSRTEVFKLKGGKALPPGFSLTATADFKEVLAQGGLADVTVGKIQPDLTASVTMTLRNAMSVRDAEYQGAITLTPSDPHVMVVPNEISAKFSTRAVQMVTVGGAAGTKLPLDFRAASPDQQAAVLNFEFDGAARQGSGQAEVRITQDASNPSSLNLGKDIGLGAAGQGTAVVTAKSNQLEVRVRPSAGLVPGKYSGALEVSSTDLSFRGDALTAGADGHQAKLPWTLTVPSPPLPLWIWILVALAAALLLLGLAYYFLKPAVLPDVTLNLMEPEKRDINLYGKRKMEFGVGGSELANLATSFSIAARRQGRQTLAVLIPKSGNIMIKKAGKKQEEALYIEEPIYDGDILRFENYRIRVNSFNLTRPDE